MDLIDDKGRIFGTVNIIDALAVLLLLAVVGAGAAFVLQSDPGARTPTSSAQPADQNTSPATRYATLDLGTYPSDVAEHITDGDTSRTTDLTVTDVYRTPTKNSVHVWARVQLDGHTTDDSTEFRFTGTEIDRGNTLAIATDEYQINGTVRTVDTHTATLPTDATPVVLRTTTSAETATAIQPNDTYTVANGTVATVESVAVSPTDTSQKKRVVLGVTLQTLRLNDQREFLGRTVRLDQTLPIRTDTYAITGQVVHHGDTTPPGEQTTTTATIKLSGVAPDIADGIATGMVEQDDEDVRARIIDTQIEPASVVLTTQNGTIHHRDHPTKKDVSLTVELQTRRTDAGLFFHGTQLQEDTTLVLDLGSITVRGQVVDLQ